MVTPYYSRVCHDHVPVECAVESHFHKTLNYFTMAYWLYCLMIIVLSVYDHNLFLL
ncbi:unnamed protein product [Callosobruchus maculatus]|uniref:Uncharacterized protein n=1 Tax=Callosobruchus maculatus TaxID=64391 RepID=A0A653BVC9_CALMS|nr:unnamed protein product [Callosobruchus maculatus]